MKPEDNKDIKGKKEKSQFNAAIAQLVRLHNIKQDIIECRRRGDIQIWITNLFCFREELNPCMNSDENTQSNIDEKELENIEPGLIGNKNINNLDMTKVIKFQRHLYKIEERLGLAHQTAEDEWADDEDW